MADEFELCVCGHFASRHLEDGCLPGKHPCPCPGLRTVATVGKTRTGKMPSRRLALYLTKRGEDGLQKPGEEHALQKAIVKLWSHGCDIRMIEGGCDLEGEPGIYGGLTVCDRPRADEFRFDDLRAMIGPDGTDVLTCKAHRPVMEGRVQAERDRLEDEELRLIKEDVAAIERLRGSSELRGGDLRPVEWLDDTRPGDPGFKGF